MEARGCFCTTLDLEQSWIVVILCCDSTWRGCRCTVYGAGNWSSSRVSQEGRRGSCDLALLPALCLNCAARLAGLARSGRASRWGEGRGKAVLFFFPQHSNAKAGKQINVWSRSATVHRPLADAQKSKIEARSLVHKAPSCFLLALVMGIS